MGLGERIGRVDPVRVLGKVTSATIEKGKTIIVGGHGRIVRYNEEMSGLEQRIQELKLQVEGNEFLGESERENMMERISLL